MIRPQRHAPPPPPPPVPAQTAAPPEPDQGQQAAQTGTGGLVLPQPQAPPVQEQAAVVPPVPGQQAQAPPAPVPPPPGPPVQAQASVVPPVPGQQAQAPPAPVPPPPGPPVQAQATVVPPVPGQQAQGGLQEIGSVVNQLQQQLKDMAEANLTPPTHSAGFQAYPYLVSQDRATNTAPHAAFVKKSERGMSEEIKAFCACKRAALDRDYVLRSNSKEVRKAAEMVGEGRHVPGQLQLHQFCMKMKGARGPRGRSANVRTQKDEERRGLEGGVEAGGG
uniref:Uncharacterized protein n=1 Tax=Branchiostoma floridae TaxID=7739 RepID=C3ZDM9_BRAFL|eukprot:XP_002592824.1 hypothetical protein BRAFLDRAFT_65408 [Branchiostoma floridae]